MSDIQILKLKEAATFLNISTNTLYYLTQTKQIPHFRYGKKMIRFNKAELQEWIKNKQINVENSIN